MTPDPSSQVSRLLTAVRAGDEEARNQLVSLVYEELRRVAAGLMIQERQEHTLQPTALLNEAFVRLVDQNILQLTQSRRHLFAAATRAMRQVLVDHARRRASDKRGGGWGRQPIEETLEHYSSQNVDLVALDDCLDQLAALDPRQSQIVEMRFFGGFTVTEVADLLDLSVSLVEKESRKAMAFLSSRLAGEG